MKTDRLLSRVPSAKVVGRGKIFDRKLVFNKKSRDGSGKANLEDSSGDVVWGVLYEISSSELRLLDKIEGGYHRLTMHVQKDDETLIEAEVYASNELAFEAIPFDWYKELLICGAQEHQLPREYVKFLKGFPSKRDLSINKTELELG